MNALRINLLPHSTISVRITLISPAVNAAGQCYSQQNLVSDGLISANHTGTSTLYDGLGGPNALVVTIPAALGSAGLGSPTGILVSGSSDLYDRAPQTQIAKSALTNRTALCEERW